MNATVEDAQDYLNELSVPKRMMKALAILKKELELLNMQKEISRQVEEKFTKEQRRYLLTEQLKHIQKELGITRDEKGAVIQKFLDIFNPVKCGPQWIGSIQHRPLVQYYDSAPRWLCLRTSNI
jgi:ATP-dependent Lon protease